MRLNIATILIASTVLGTSENDQIHFFYHFLEKRRDGTVEESLRHTLRVAGRAILFATLINAGGFLAFGLGRAAADAAVRRARGAGLRALDDRRLHGAAGGAVDPVPRPAGRRSPGRRRSAS